MELGIREGDLSEMCTSRCMDLKRFCGMVLYNVYFYENR